MNKKTKKTATLTAGGVGLVIAASLLTIGGIRLFGGQIAKKDDKVITKIAHVEFDKEFFKDSTRTTASSANSTYEQFSYTIPDTDYVVEVLNGIFEGTTAGTTPLHSFEKDLFLYSVGGAAYGIHVKNLKSTLCYIEGYDSKDKLVKEEYIMNYREGDNVNNPSESSLPAGFLQHSDIVELKSITFYGDPDAQPKSVTKK